MRCAGRSRKGSSHSSRATRTGGLQSQLLWYPHSLPQTPRGCPLSSHRVPVSHRCVGTGLPGVKPELSRARDVETVNIKWVYERVLSCAAARGPELQPGKVLGNVWGNNVRVGETQTDLNAWFWAEEPQAVEKSGMLRS